ncbi:MAG TPA: putative hydro-lyase [Gemmataceae bacterium]|nr:putative hydro-lyase [Gemmataceae bacterium]
MSKNLQHATGKDIRLAAREGALTAPTAGLAMGHVQANLVIVPKELAFDFLLFCQRNPKPCPLLDVTEPGKPEPAGIAAGADLRSDLPKYRVWKNGDLIDEPPDIRKYWRDDLVAFLIGCSFTFENALLAAGVPVRHIEMHRNVPMYSTNIACRPAGRFHGPMVVSMRPMTPAQVFPATTICSRFGRAHGTPVHFGDPATLGIKDLSKPDFGDAVPVQPGEVPVFWACGVTPQAVVMAAKPPLAITHSPGHMFVTDMRDCDLENA